MTKKRIWLLAAAGILVLTLAAPSAFGAITDDGRNAQNQQLVDQMFNWHQGWLDQAQNNGSVSPEQAEAWQEHFDYMRDFHAQNGFGTIGHMFGGGCVTGGYYNPSQTD